MIRILALGLSTALVAGIGLAGAAAQEGDPTIHEGDASWRLASMAALAPEPSEFESATTASDPDTYIHEEEIAYGDLDPTGLPINSHVISRVSSKGGEERTVLTPFTTTNVEYLNRRGQPVVKSTGVEVSVGGPTTNTTIMRGLMDKPLPIAIHAEYKLNGEVVDPTAVVGASGNLRVKYTVTNIDVKTETISYKDASGKTITKETPVFAPMVGNLVTRLPSSWEVTNPDAAVVTTDDTGDSLLNWNLVVYPPMGNYIQEAMFEARVDTGVIPATILTMAPTTTEQDPATGFSDELLKGSVSGSEQLAEGLGQLNDQTLNLASGAAELASGLAQLADGADSGATEVNNQLVPGSNLVAQGTAGVAQGQAALSNALKIAASGAGGLSLGAAGLDTGMNALVAGLKALAETGLPALSKGTKKIEKGADQLADLVGNSKDQPLPTPTPTIIPAPIPIPTPSGTPVFPTPTAVPTPTSTPTLWQLTDATRRGAAVLTQQLVTLNNNLIPLVSTLGTAAAQSATAATAAGTAELILTGLYAAVCPPPASNLTLQQCAEMLAAEAAAGTAATTSSGVATSLTGATVDLAKETVRAYATALGSAAITRGLVAIQKGVNEVGKALRSGNPAPGKQGLVEALDELILGLDAAVLAAELLADGAKLLENGSTQVASGAAQLSTGLDQSDTGAAQLADISEQVAQGAAVAAFGTAEVAKALAGLSTGLDQSADGSSQLASGASALQSEGTAKLLQSVVDSSAQPAEAAAYLEAVNKRAATALPYGPAEGATASGAYILTMEEVAPSHTSGWLIAALIVLLASAVGGAIVKQVRSQD